MVPHMLGYLLSLEEVPRLREKQLEQSVFVGGEGHLRRSSAQSAGIIINHQLTQLDDASCVFTGPASFVSG